MLFGQGKEMGEGNDVGEGWGKGGKGKVGKGDGGRLAREELETALDGKRGWLGKGDNGMLGLRLGKGYKGKVG